MKYDLHTHTKHSRCSLIKPGENIKAAVRAGLAGIAVTDHNSIKGALETARLARKNKEFEVIIGEEVMTDIGEILAYYITEHIKPGRAVDVIDNIKSQGGLVCLAHPYSVGIIRKKTGIEKEILRKIDCIEAFNARTSNSANRLASALAKKSGLAMTGGSDGHFLGEIGNGHTICKSDLHKEILQRKVRAGGNNSLFWFWRCVSFPVRLVR
ncbi:PHP domain-containing protein [Candidatus Woesearchaeota archaeon]|nr:PHP domain-containing protein [Candidatus Woesearchaeota archaeon]